MNAATSYRVSVKLGAAEFDAEGPEDTVKEQLAHFFIAASQPSLFPSKSNGNGASHVTSLDNGQPKAEAQAETSGFACDGLEFRTSLDLATLQRLFKHNEEGLITLR